MYRYFGRKSEVTLNTYIYGLNADAKAIPVPRYLGRIGDRIQKIPRSAGATRCYLLRARLKKTSKNMRKYSYEAKTQKKKAIRREHLDWRKFVSAATNSHGGERSNLVDSKD